VTHTSLRARLTLWFTSLLIVVGLLGTVCAYFLARQEPDTFLDDQLRQIAVYAGDGVGGAERLPGPALDPSDLVLVQVWDRSGTLLRSTIPEVDLARQPATGFSDPIAAGAVWRTYTLIETNRTVQVSQRAAVREELALDAALRVLIPSALLLPLSWVMVRSLVRRILRPIRVLADELSARAPDSTAPLHATDMPIEIAPLVEAMNATLGRIGEVMDLQRRFVSDAAHQLRTPLTALRLQVQNLKRRPPAKAPEVLADLELGLNRMSTLTGQLLALARAEASLKPLIEPTSLPEVVAEAVANCVPAARAKGIALSSGCPDGLRVRSERHDLLMLVSNLLDNAVRYTPEGGRVEVSATSDSDGVAVEITDSGPGIPEPMLGRVFDQFVRHTDDPDGTGLGLSIVRAIAERVGVHVVLRNRSGGNGLIARVEFPNELDHVPAKGEAARSQPKPLIPS
jgi:two-component system OmpR family sensor kinase